MNSNSPFQNIFSWIKNTPERAIDEAFEAGVNVKRIEEKNFNGNKIANDGSLSNNVFSVFEIQLQKQIRTINAKLSFYKVSASLPYLQPQNAENLANTDLAIYKNNQVDDPVSNGQLSSDQLSGNSQKFSIYQKLGFIDYILAKYSNPQTIDVVVKTASKQSVNSQNLDLEDSDIEPDQKFQLFKNSKSKIYTRSQQQVASVEKSILPGSFFKAFDRVKRNLSGSYSDYEKDIVEELRQSRQRINKALRYILILIFSVIIIQFLSKILIFSPLINSLSNSNNTTVNFSPAVEEKAFNELKLAKERIEFDHMIKSILLEQTDSKKQPDKIDSHKSESSQPEINQTELAKVEGKANEEVEILIRQESVKILKKFNDASLDGVKNLLADITSAFVFYIFLLSGRQELSTIKEFLDEVLYSLNDNAKAFLIIISTDTFVGFHSSEGWDALLTVLFEHFGLPENKILAQSFISTVPVFLDGLFKFWIFQYLTQASPATATIYREMNE